ncbi:hypothetical protein AVDCRST_MAG94-4308 [uncultured Leptolyngbya sp.]|uniref:Uncharacterized protein n=1 Tax=uncultured Leptolyngbya sp. TaxID=332963 RepID=A0A6J4MZ83_9CYAN|nr:hypothetical protein AVDCRST_MAG94-4308 [uncultured Leptolyngbya sp.]
MTNCVWCCQSIDPLEAIALETSLLVYGKKRSYDLLYHPDCYSLLQEHQSQVIRRNGRPALHRIKKVSTHD